MVQGSLQLGVLRLCFFNDWDVGVGIFPESEKILIRSLGFRGIAGQRVGSTETQMRQGADRFISNYSRMIENLLKLRDRCGSVFRRQIGLPPEINRIERKGEVLVRVSQIVRRSRGK